MVVGSGSYGVHDTRVKTKSNGCYPRNLQMKRLLRDLNRAEATEPKPEPKAILHRSRCIGMGQAEGDETDEHRMRPG
jgi:hypothetical protein